MPVLIWLFVTCEMVSLITAWIAFMFVSRVTNVTFFAENCHFASCLKAKRDMWCIALNSKPVTELRSITCHMGSSLSLCCHSTQVNAELILVVGYIPLIRIPRCFSCPPTVTQPLDKSPAEISFFVLFTV